MRYEYKSLVVIVTVLRLVDITHVAEASHNRAIRSNIPAKAMANGAQHSTDCNFGSTVHVNVFVLNQVGLSLKVLTQKCTSILAQIEV